jgi:hypothetical protein
MFTPPVPVVLVLGWLAMLVLVGLWEMMLEGDVGEFAALDSRSAMLTIHDAVFSNQRMMRGAARMTRRLSPRQMSA